MPIRTTIAMLAVSSALVFGQKKPEPGVETQMILTVADHTSHKPAALKAGDVTILDATITEMQALDGDLQLYLLIDDAANYDFSRKLRELIQFVGEHPTTVPIGLAYIHDGSLQVVDTPTTDRAKLVHDLRLPSGSKAANPYCALSDLMAQWKQPTLRREIILVSTGIDDTATDGAVCANAETTIRDAERSGVQIFGLYNPVPDYLTSSWSKVDSGITDLAHVCYESGGEAYLQGHSPLDSIKPYLDDIAEHLQHQYLVKFRITPDTDPGMRTIFVMTGGSNPEVMTPQAVWVRR